MGLKEANQALRDALAVLDGQKKPLGDCTHRLGSYHLMGCSSCKGNVQIKVFDCEIHKRCTIRQHTGLIKACTGCADFMEIKNGE
jgi:hypothetical protein